MQVLFVVAGILGVIWVLNDIFKAVLVPRAIEAPFRISVMGARTAWRIARSVALRMRSDKRREEFLGAFAPFAFVMLIALWLVALIVFYGLIYYGLRDQINPMPNDFGTAVYAAGTSVLAVVAFGDFTPVGVAARIASLCAGASGVGTFAITIAFIFALNSAVQDRERFVVVLDGRAGAPPSGLALLETFAIQGILADLPALFRDAENWVADVLNSHLAYPLLMFFRSSHKDESWIAALGALLDAAALLVTVIEDSIAGEARLFLDVGMHLTHDLAAYYDLPSVRTPRPTQAERDAVCGRLRAAGFKLRADDDPWNHFYELRTIYGDPLLGIAQRWLTPPAQLVGERTALPGHAA